MNIQRKDLTDEEIKLFDLVIENRNKMIEYESKLELVFDKHKNEKIKQYIGKTYQNDNGDYIFIIGYLDMVIQVIELMSDTVIHFTSIHSLDLYTEIPKEKFLERYHKILKFFVDKIGE